VQRSPEVRRSTPPRIHRSAPIRRRWAAIGCAVALSAALAACGSSGNSSGTSATTSPSSSSGQTLSTALRIFTPEELGAALLTEADLGSGWTQTQRDVFTVRAPENPAIEDSWSLCPAAAEQGAALVTLTPPAGADAEFEHPQPGAKAHLMRQQASSDAQTETYFAALKKAIEPCDGTTWTDPAGTTTTARVVPAPPVGEESISLDTVMAIPTPTGDMASLSHATLARFGTALMSTSEGTVTPAATNAQTSDAEWQSIVNTAAAKFTNLTSS